MIYTSLENARVKEYHKLHQKKYRDQTNLFLVEGEHLVLEAKKAGCLKTLIVEENTDFSLEVDTMVVSHSVLSYLSELDSPQPVMGVCYKLEPREIRGNVFVLEDIQDPGNLGTIIRSAVAFGIDTLLISDHSVDLYNDKVVRATQGLLFHMNFIIGSLEESLLLLKEKGYHIFGTRVTHGKDLKTIEKNLLFAIIMGNEGKGMSEKIGEFCEDYVYIPMSSACESLNVGVAASILMYELSK